MVKATGGGSRPLPGPKHVATMPLPVQRKSGPLYRICRADRDPLYFGKASIHRFDAPRGEYGVLYAAATPEGAFVETCIRERSGGSLLDLSFLQARKLVQITFPGSLRLVDLTGPGLSLLRVDARLTTGSYRAAQRWSRAFWRHPDGPDGILYRSRFNPSLDCMALFDRAGAAFSSRDCGALADPENLRFLGDMLDVYNLAL